MGKITEIVTQKNDKSRVSVFVDGVFCVGLEKITLINNRLNVGDEIEETRLSQIQAESEMAVAFDKAIKKLESRQRSVKEIKDYLAEKGYGEEVVENVVLKLSEYGYVNDLRFAEAFVSSYKKRYGGNKIAYLLGGLGVSQEIIDNVLQDTDFVSQAVKMLVKFSEKRSNCNAFDYKKFLYLKGFDQDTISSAITAFVDGDLDEMTN